MQILQLRKESLLNDDSFQTWNRGERYIHYEREYELRLIFRLNLWDWPPSISQ